MSTTSITATELLTRRGDILRRCSRDKENFTIELHGVPIVALIPIENYMRHYAPKRRKTMKLPRKANTATSSYKTVYEALERARRVDKDPSPHVIASDDKANQAGAALMRLKGIVKAPNLRDASKTIDTWVYGPPLVEAHD